MLDEFYSKVNYYRKEAEAGHYHNPYDVDNELNELLMKAGKSNDQELEDLAYEVSSLFWSM